MLHKCKMCQKKNSCKCSLCKRKCMCQGVKEWCSRYKEKETNLND